MAGKAFYFSLIVYGEWSGVSHDRYHLRPLERQENETIHMSASSLDLKAIHSVGFATNDRRLRTGGIPIDRAKLRDFKDCHWHFFCQSCSRAFP